MNTIFSETGFQMFMLQKRPNVIPSDAVLVFLLKTKTCTSLGVELVTLWTSLSSVSLLPPPCINLSVPQCHLLSQLRQHYFCTSNLFIRGSDSSPCDAANLAHEISVCSHCCHANQFNRDGGMAAHPPNTHANNAQAHTRSHHSPL